MLRAGDRRGSGLSVAQPGPGALRISRRSVLAGSAGTAALIASPDLFSALREPAAASAGSIRSAFFLYGVTGAADPAGATVRAARPPALRHPARVSLRPVATRLAGLPAQSADRSALALITTEERSDGAAVTLTLVDMLSGTAESGGTLELPDLPPATSLLVTPVFSADFATVALVLSITVPTSMRNVSKINPHTGRAMTVPTATWTSHHALAYFDRGTASFTGPYHLSDAPSLALVSAAADARHLYLWTVKEAAAVRSRNGHPWQDPVPRFSSYPLGSGTARFCVPAPGPWPTGGEPVAMLATGHIARLVNGRQVLLYSPRSGEGRQIRLAALDVPSTKPGAVTLAPRPDGTVFINNPAIGRAVIADPAGSFRETAVISYPRPAGPFGGPCGKAALSQDGRMVYVLGPAGAGGLSAYDIRTGVLAASYSHGEHYTGVYQLASSVLLAVSPTRPQLVFFTPSLMPIGTADTDVRVAAVF